MRKAVAIMLVLILLALITGCSGSRQSAQVQAPRAVEPPPAASSSSTNGGDLPGDLAALKAARAQKSSVTFEIVTVNEAVSNRDAHLDTLLAQKKWPGPSMLVLAVYAKDGYDVRFAMGSAFTNKVTVPDMLTIVRTTYLPKARENNAAGGLAELIKAVNQRMTP